MGNEVQKDGLLLGRRLEFFHQEAKAEWGYTKPQSDSFALMHPAKAVTGKVPLYVVFHSAGHDLYSCLGCLWQEHYHDIYITPENMYGLYLDCRRNPGDWWWGGINAKGEGDPARSGTKLQPVENRVLATIRYIMENYPIDPERIYGVGNSMGGSGALGIGLNHGDLFAALKVNVPAGVRHAADRCCLDTPEPAGFQIPDPPVVVDYSGSDDEWSNGHEILYKGMREKRYALYGYWAPFGHANSDPIMEAQNDMIHTFDLLSLRCHEPYPAFTDSSTDDPIPWPDHRNNGAGQVNAFLRWKNIADEKDAAEMALFLPAETWKSRVKLPESVTTTVTLRRLQNFKAAPGETIRFTYGGISGSVKADAKGKVTVPNLKVTAKETVLRIFR